MELEVPGFRFLVRKESPLPLKVKGLGFRVYNWVDNEFIVGLGVYNRVYSEFMMGFIAGFRASEEAPSY